MENCGPSTCGQIQESFNRGGFSGGQLNKQGWIFRWTTKKNGQKVRWTWIRGKNQLLPPLLDYNITARVSNFKLQFMGKSAVTVVNDEINNLKLRSIVYQIN